MSNSLVLNTSLNYSGNSIALNLSAAPTPITVTGNGLSSLSQFTATTSAIAIPLGSTSVAGGWLFIQNLDPTNYIQVLTSTVGTVFARILSGEFLLMRLDASVTAPAVQAHTANCIIKFVLLDA